MGTLQMWHAEIFTWDKIWEHPQVLSDAQVDMLTRGICLLAQQTLLGCANEREREEVLDSFLVRFRQVESLKGEDWMRERSRCFSEHFDGA